VKTLGAIFSIAVVGVVVACSSEPAQSTGQATDKTCAPGDACICDGDGECGVTCSGAGCAVECRGNGGCRVSCPQGNCTVSCKGNGGCFVENCGNSCTCTQLGNGGCFQQ
jgi:hypothetical protein